MFVISLKCIILVLVYDQCNKHSHESCAKCFCIAASFEVVDCVLLGFLCPVHTPDGGPCGLLNHATAHCEVFCHKFLAPCPPIDSIITLMTVWRITGKIIRITIMLITYACI